ncbi:MAG: CPBP family intramembrane glutamic endopeptidase [Muribaculaceae bacterium]
MAKLLTLRLTYVQKLTLVFSLFVLFLILTAIISSLIASIIPMENTTFVKVTMMVQDILVFVVPAAITAVFITATPISFLRLNKKPTWQAIVGVLIIFIVATPVLNVIVSWNESVTLPESMKGVEQWARESEQMAKMLTDSLLKDMSIIDFSVLILLVGVLTGFSEELFFRGLLQRIFLSRPMNAHLAIWLAAFIFSALHFQFFGFVPRLLLGAFFGYLLMWTGSLWVPIIAHMINNSGVVIVQYLTQHKIIAVDVDTIGTTSDSLIIAIASAIITICAVYYFFKNTKRVE